MLQVMQLQIEVQPSNCARHIWEHEAKYYACSQVVLSLSECLQGGSRQIAPSARRLCFRDVWWHKMKQVAQICRL